MESVLVTGASGLLGSEVVTQLTKKGLYVVGQYYNNKPSDLQNCRWINSDFSSLNSVKKFLQDNKNLLNEIRYFINCYGPITYKSIKNLNTKDYENDFFSNVLVPIEIIGFLLNVNKTRLKSIVNIGFELSGEIKPVKNVLPYLMAKNALLQYSISLSKIYKNINFNMVSPITIKGAKLPSKSKKTVLPKTVTKVIIKTLMGNNSGENIKVDT